MADARNKPNEDPEDGAGESADDKKGEKKGEEKSSSGKWWEFYVVRYALGTVFGVLIVAFLATHGLGIPFPSGDIKDITKPEAAPLLVVYGLAFCYLASSPMLLFHATRFRLKKRGFRWGTVLVLGVSVALPYYWESLAADKVPVGLRVAAFMTMCLMLCVFILQFVAVYVGEYKTGEMWRFYKRLDMNRRVKANRELMDSYRHLREHGNACAVVLFEMLLGLGLYLSTRVSVIPAGLVAPCGTPSSPCDPTSSLAMAQSFVLVLLWILPGAYVWCIGCYLEGEFADDGDIGTNGPATATAAATPAVPAPAASPPAGTP